MGTVLPPGGRQFAPAFTKTSAKGPLSVAARRPPKRWYGRPGVFNGRGWLELRTHPRQGRHPVPSRAPSKRQVCLVLVMG
jgi:hypothetical protein